MILRKATPRGYEHLLQRQDTKTREGKFNAARQTPDMKET